MRHSVDQVHMDERGEIDKSRGGPGGKSKRGKFINALEQCRDKEGTTEFSFSELQRFAHISGASVSGFREMIDQLRNDGLLLFSDSTYKLPK